MRVVDREAELLGGVARKAGDRRLGVDAEQREHRAGVFGVGQATHARGQQRVVRGCATGAGSTSNAGDAPSQGSAATPPRRSISATTAARDGGKHQGERNVRHRHLPHLATAWFPSARSPVALVWQVSEATSLGLALASRTNLPA